MEGVPGADDAVVIALAGELAGLAAAVDVARVRLDMGVEEGAAWVSSVNRRDLLAVVDASAQLEAVLARVVGGESLALATGLERLVDLARRSADLDLDAHRQHARAPVPPGRVISLDDAGRSPPPGRW